MSPERSAWRGRRAAAAALAAALAGGSCVLDLPLADGVAACANGDDCPPGYVCTAGLCYSADREDSEPPSASVLDTGVFVGNRETLLEVTLAASEPLGEPPSVTFLAPAGERSLSPGVFDPASQHYTFTYRAAATDVDGVYPLQVQLIDAAGNRGGGPAGRSLVLDFTQPQVLQALVELRLTPSLATNPLAQVSAAGRTTQVEVFVATDTPVAFDAVLRPRSPGAADLRFVSADPGVPWVSVFFFGLDWDASSPVDGAYELEVVLRDEAGNEAFETLDDLLLTLDTTPPPAPATADPGRVLLERAPWGLAASAGAPRTSFAAAAGAMTQAATALLFDQPTALAPGSGATLAPVLARLAIGADGSVAATSIGGNNLSTVYVCAVDDAGNLSDANDQPSDGVQASPVQDVRFIATLLGKIAGSTAENPHEVLARPSMGPTLVQPDDAPAGFALATLAGPGLSTAGAGHWSRSFPRQALPAGAGTIIAVHDALRDRLVAFGDLEGVCPTCRNTYALVGVDWRPLPLADPESDGEPAFTELSAWAFDPSRDVGVLFGGGDAPTDALWELQASSWRRRLGPGPAPAARLAAAMAYDASSAAVVVFGGCAERTTLETCAERLGDLWRWDGAGWTELCTDPACASTAPTPRWGASLATDPSGGLLLFGGLTGADDGFTAETWSWQDGSGWTPRCTAGPCTPPPARAFAGLAADPGRGRTVLFGGCDRDLVAGSDFNCDLPPSAPVWEWDGATWLDEAAVLGAPFAGAAPQPQTAAFALVPAPGGDGVVLIETGGDTWRWSALGWSAHGDDPAGRPSPRTGAAAAVLEAGGDEAVVLFGGCFAPDCPAPLSDTWRFDGDTWQQATPATPPAAVSSAAMAYDPTSDALLLAGGLGAGRVPTRATWKWADGEWTPGLDLPSPVYGHGMSTSPLGPRLVGLSATLYAPYRYDDGVPAWTNDCAGACGAQPSVIDHGIAYDPVRDELLVFGSGMSVSDVLWIFGDPESDGSYSWRQLTPATGPRWRQDLRMVWDPGREQVLLFGGNNFPIMAPPGASASCAAPDDPFCSDLWAWDGAAWQPLIAADPEGDGDPPQRGSPALAALPTRDSVMLFGGHDRDSLLDDTWQWHGGASARAAHIVRVAFAASGARRAPVSSIAFTWCGDAVGFPGGVETHGASASLWDGTAWMALAATAQPAAEVPYSGAGSCRRGSTAVDPAWASAALARLFVGDQGLLSLAVSPSAANGTGSVYGSVRTDYVEVTVTYGATP